MYIPLTLVLSGAVGNLIDRVRIGGRVIDFIDFRIWPIFNFADSAIVCGMLVLLIHVLFHNPGKEEEEGEVDANNLEKYREDNEE